MRARRDTRPIPHRTLSECLDEYQTVAPRVQTSDDLSRYNVCTPRTLSKTVELPAIQVSEEVGHAA
jgi:hypothetical protein